MLWWGPNLDKQSSILPVKFHQPYCSFHLPFMIFLSSSYPQILGKVWSCNPRANPKPAMAINHWLWNRLQLVDDRFSLFSKCSNLTFTNLSILHPQTMTITLHIWDSTCLLIPTTMLPLSWVPLRSAQTTQQCACGLAHSSLNPALFSLQYSYYWIYYIFIYSFLIYFSHSYSSFRRAVSLLFTAVSLHYRIVPGTW